MEVTVLLTTFNHEKYIAQALDSVLMQETSFDYEIVILEDCSTDATRDIVKAYHQQNPTRIRLRLAERNQHSNKPFTEEFAAASGRYIAMLDGDDYWTSPTKLQRQVEFLDTHPECTICFHNALRIYEGEDRAPLLYNSAEQKEISDVTDLWEYCFIAGCTPLLRKGAIGRLPQWYNTLPVGDWPLFLLASEHGRIGYIDEVLGVYRIHKGGAWSKLDNVQRIELMIDLYHQLNASFGFRYDQTVQPLISRWTARLQLARNTGQFLDSHVPSNSTVIVIAKPEEELPRLRSRQVWPFPVRTPRQTRQLFARGASGSAEAPWIDKATYQFELFQEAEQRQLLASVTVSQNIAGRTSNTHDAKVETDKPYIIATPNPVPQVSGFGRAVIRWSTGDGSPGVVEVTTEDRQLHHPRNSADAIKEIEQLRLNGAQLLFVPPSARLLFERYPDLQPYVEQNYRLITSEPDVGSLYDLFSPQLDSERFEEPAR